MSQNLSELYKEVKSGVIKTMQSERLKKLATTKAAKLITSHPHVTLGATAGLGLWLFSRALNSKRQDQGDY